MSEVAAKICNLAELKAIWVDDLYFFKEIRFYHKALA